MSNKVTVYYHSLVRWEKVDEIVFLTEPHEHASVRELVLKTLDHAIMEAILHKLDEPQHEVFLVMCQERYHDETLLDWLEEQVEDIREYLRQVVQTTKTEMKQLLHEDEQDTLA